MGLPKSQTLSDQHFHEKVQVHALPSPYTRRRGGSARVEAQQLAKFKSKWQKLRLEVCAPLPGGRSAGARGGLAPLPQGPQSSPALDLELLKGREPSIHRLLKKHHFFNWSVLVGSLLQNWARGMGGEGRRKMPALGRRSTEPCGGPIFTPGRATGPHRQLLRGKRPLGPYSLAMARASHLSPLPQSAIVTSFQSLSRPSVLCSLPSVLHPGEEGRVSGLPPPGAPRTSVQLGGLRPTREGTAYKP